MNLLNKLTIKNLKLNKKRTIVTIIGIILSSALITAVASMYSSGIKSLIKYETREKGNFHVAYYDVPVENIDVFKNNREIEKLNLSKNIGYAKIASKNDYKPYAFIKAFSKSSLENLSIKLVQGRLPENSNEIIIPTHLKTNGRLVLKIGDTITLDVGKRTDKDGIELKQNNPFQPSDTLEENKYSNIGENVDSKNKETDSEKIVDTSSKTYKIVGIIERPASNIESYSAPGYTFITYLDEENLSGYVDIYARYTKDGTKNAYELTANIIGVDEDIFVKANTKGNISYENYMEEMKKAKYDISINDYLIGLEINPIGSSQIVGLGAVLCIVIMVIIFTSVFCIKNSFDISITEKIKQYGMLRSIGATKKQIKKNVFYEATVLGLIGIPLGILFGFLASFILVLISNYYFSSITEGAIELQFNFSIISILVSILLGTITIYFSAFRSAHRASKVSPIDSIRNSAGIKINRKKLKSSKIIKKIFGIGGEISYKNLKRNKKKYRTTVISIITSVFVFIGLSGFMNMAYSEAREELDYLEYNLALTSNNITDENLNNFINTTTFDNIENSSIIRHVEFVFQNPKYSKEYLNWNNIKNLEDVKQKEYIQIYALGNTQYQKYIKQLGIDYENIKNKAILYDYHENLKKYDAKGNIVKQENLKILDYNINDKIKGNLENGQDYTFEIGAISKKLPFGLQSIPGEMLFVSDELFEKIANTSRLQIFYKSNNASLLQDEIDDALEEEIYSLNNSEENVKIMENLLTLVGIFLYGFIIVVSLIGITNIFNTITTNMELRKPEFAMLKSIGMTKKEFNKMIRLESIFIGCKALLIGISLGVGISYLIYIKFNEVNYNFPIVAILISIFTVFILIILIMKYSISKINKQNIIETIRNENI